MFLALVVTALLALAALHMELSGRARIATMMIGLGSAVVAGWLAARGAKQAAIRVLHVCGFVPAAAAASTDDSPFDTGASQTAAANAWANMESQFPVGVAPFTVAFSIKFQRTLKRQLLLACRRLSPRFQTLLLALPQACRRVSPLEWRRCPWMGFCHHLGFWQERLSSTLRSPRQDRTHLSHRLGWC